MKKTQRGMFGILVLAGVFSFGSFLAPQANAAGYYSDAQAPATPAGPTNPVSPAAPYAAYAPTTPVVPVNPYVPTSPVLPVTPYVPSVPTYPVVPGVVLRPAVKNTIIIKNGPQRGYAPIFLQRY